MIISPEFDILNKFLLIFAVSDKCMFFHLKNKARCVIISLYLNSMEILKTYSYTKGGSPMKTLKKVIAVTMAMLMLFATVSVAFTSLAATKKVTKVKLNKTSLTMYTTQTVKLKATVSPSNATNKNVQWKSSNTKVATVDSKGNVKAVKKGTATITCTAKDGSKKKATCKVTVNKKVAVTSVKLNKSSVSIVKGKTTTLKATVNPSNASVKGVKWSTSNKDVATVSSSGKITAVGVGTATITCKSSDNSKKKATCKVTVTPVKVTSITLSKTSATIYPGKSVTITATVNPSNAANKNVKWTSSNSNIATVDSKGVVRGVKSGTATITCTAQDGSKKSATCKITVGVPATAVTITTTETSANAWYVGKTGKLTATVSPTNATNKGVTWSSSNTNYATVDSKGNVTIKKYNSTITSFNKVTITAKSNYDSSVKATYTINIVKNKVAVTGVNFNTTDNNNIWLVGKEYTLIASTVPSNASNNKLTFKSSNNSIATVDSKGVLKALKAGTVVITATSADNTGISQTITINIQKPSLKVKISSQREYYAIGESATLKYEATPPAIATRYGLKYEVSDPTMAVISQIEGYNYASIKFLKPGKVKVRARTTGSEVIGDWFEIEVREVTAAKDFFENVKAGDTINIDAYVSNGTGRVDTGILYTTPNTDCLSISDDGKSVKILKDLGDSGAYLEATSVDGRMSCKIYFIAGKYVIPTSNADRLALMKKLSASMNNDTFSSTYSKSVAFSGINVNEKKSDTSLTINDVSLDIFLIGLGAVGISKDEIMEGISAESFIKEMYGEPYTESKTAVSQSSCPKAITIDESAISGFTVKDNGSTFDIRMNLKNDSKRALASVSSSPYAMAMPVIDKAFLDNYMSTFNAVDDETLEIKKASYGTVNETYKSGYVTFTVDKFSGKVVDGTYHYTSALDISDAALNLVAKMDDTDSSLELGFNIKATFTMNVDTTLRLGDIYYQ